MGKQIRVEGPSSHVVKMGTPTMGGILIIVPAIIITVVANLVGRYSILLPLAVVAACTAIGLVDDMMNLVGGRTGGLSARVKFAVPGHRWGCSRLGAARDSRHGHAVLPHARGVPDGDMVRAGGCIWR